MIASLPPSTSQSPPWSLSNQENLGVRFCTGIENCKRREDSEGATPKRLKLTDSNNEQQENLGVRFCTGIENCKRRKDSGGATPKRFKLTDSNNEQVEKPSLLGLRLRKTPSFLNSIEMTLSKATRASQIESTETRVRATPSKSTERKSVTKVWNNNCDTPPNVEKLKASNFSALFLKIGSWERVCRYEGDLVAKIYFAKRKLVWEILESGLKSKIEIQWPDISAINATFCENQPGILEIELSHPPLFFHETNPQPRKHTLWQASSDFTGGQATTFRKHYLQFPEGVLEKHYENLLQCDYRLNELSQKPFPSLNTPYVLPNYGGFTDYYDKQHMKIPGINNTFKDSSLLQFSQTGIARSIHVPIQQVPNFELFGPTISANGLNSPFSVIDLQLNGRKVVNGQVGDQENLFWDGTASQGISSINRCQIEQATPFPFAADQITSLVPQHLSSNSVSTTWTGQNSSNNWSLNDISQQMLNEASTNMHGADEQNVLAEVNLMHSLLAPSQMNLSLESINVEHVEFGQENMSNLLTFNGKCSNSVSGFPVQQIAEIPLNNLPQMASFPYSFWDQEVGDSLNDPWKQGRQYSN